jgi:L-aminopeptidase/D-esterase-like protein
MASSIDVVDNRFVSNTTLAILVTNAKFEKSQLCKIAGMGHDGYARSIRPVHTSYDGDSIYAASVGEVKADQEVVGTLGADVIAEAIKRAVYSAKGAYGLPALCDLELGG